jgi:CheY-like chemotaxis protein
VPHTLLLADDSVTIQRVIELTFADEDVTVVAVGDGDQAIEQLEASPPDIVLADIGMPGKSGYEVAQYIRRSPKLEHIPVVLLTGAFEPVDQARADDAKCDGVLAKPFEPQMVIGRVKELLGRPPRTGAADFSPPTADTSGLDSSVSPSQAWMASGVDPLVADQPPVNEPAPSFGQAPADTQVRPPQADLNAYFDRLDTAFNPPAPGASTGATADVTTGSAAAPPAGLDWFSGLGHTPDTQQESVASDAVADLLLHQHAPVDESSAVHQTEPAPVEEIEPVPAAAHVEESAAIISAAPPASGPAAIEEARHTEAPPTAHAAIAEPQAPPAPVAESRPAAATTASPVERTAVIEPVRIASVAPALAAPRSVPAREFPLKNPVPVPPLADAFAALLAAEQGAAPAVSWPASSSPASVSDATIETITRRVLDRLSDTVVRQTVSDIVSTIAERLVREEIERIKASIK